MISIDYETHLIGNGAVFPKPVCLSWYDGEETGLLNRKETVDFLSKTINESISTITQQGGVNNQQKKSFWDKLR